MNGLIGIQIGVIYRIHSSLFVSIPDSSRLRTDNSFMAWEFYISTYDRHVAELGVVKKAVKMVTGLASHAWKV